ncbi:MAG: FG-GAP-like repeat-containing protein [Phycisphaerales bacterium]|jgi:hypothetical protein|nr:FG-GAP-like repeat-containing protein [Phycisphaerales bacterium]
MFGSLFNVHYYVGATSKISTYGTSSSSKQRSHLETSTSESQSGENRNVGSTSWEDVTTVETSGEGHENHRGSAWCDFDNDGLIDLYSSHFGVFYSGNYFGSPNQLLRNIGDGQFEDVTTAESSAGSGLSHHPAWADIDNDGLPDIFVSQSSNSGTGNSVLLHHDSVGVFTDITNGDPTAMEGILPRGIGWQDINGDGFVDLLVSVSSGDDKKNRMLINQGDGSFTWDESLFSDEMVEGRSVGWCDYNNDNLPDVYIANGAEDNSDVPQRTNQLFKNLGNGEWVDVASSAGVDDVGHGRGHVWGDINNDGYLDLFVGNQKGSDTGGGHNKLYKNNGNGTFSNITVSAGMYASFRTRCVSMADYNNDGFLDIYVVNFGGAAPPNHLFRNNGNNTFTEVGEGTLIAGALANGAAGSWADFDNDGWIDIYIVGGSTYSPGVGQNRLLRNTNQNGNHWFEIELCGTTTNRSAIGSRVTITHMNEDDEMVSQMREIQSGTGYNSGNMFRAHFGLGSSDEIIDLTVRWPSGIVQIISNLETDQIIRVVEDDIFALDCNRNCVPDYQDILDGYSSDDNENGVPDECDCTGDIDGNGTLDVNDLIEIILNWGSTTSPLCDLNGDGVVEVNDLIIIVQIWNSCQ